MKQIDAAFEQRLRNNPNTQVRVIVRTKGNPSQFTQALESKGLHVVRTSTLINAATVEGTAKATLALCDEDWVERIEEDKPVHTM